MKKRIVLFLAISSLLGLGAAYRFSRTSAAPALPQAQAGEVQAPSSPAFAVPPSESFVPEAPQAVVKAPEVSLSDRANELIDEFDLEPGLWAELSSLPIEKIDERIVAMKKDYEGLKARTDEISKERSQYVENGDAAKATELLQQMMPLFNERRKLSARVMLGAYAKAEKHQLAQQTVTQ